MSRPAAEFHLIDGRVAVWQTYEPAVKTDLSCSALLTPRGFVFVDPIPLANEALEELTALAKPCAIVLTNGNHARASVNYRERFSIPIWAHREAIPALEIPVDQELSEAVEIAPGLCPIEVHGAGPGEVALHFENRLFAFGDALINVESHGFSLLPDKYCADPKTMHRSLEKLLRLEFELLTFAHGLPLLSSARQRLESLLA